MKLYGSIASPYVARVVLFATIKGIDLPVSEPVGGHIKSPEYLKLNPLGKMPTLEVNGQGIAESSVICDYLEDVYPEPSGFPKDPLDRARSRLVARLIDVYFAPQVGPFFRNMNPAKRDAAAVEAAGKELAKAMGYVEQALGPGPFCVGATPTFGDCALPSIMMTQYILRTGNFDVPDPVSTPRLQAWVKALTEHPKCGPVLSEHSAALAAMMKSMMGARK
jgi:glutathione S-transferase